MLSFSSKRNLWHLIATLCLCILTTSACALKRQSDARLTPKSLPYELTTLVKSLQERELRNKERSSLTDLYEPSDRLTACEWIQTLGQPDSEQNSFRILSQMGITMEGEVYGQVDAAGSPLYAYALAGQTIPDREEFLSLVKKEAKRTFKNFLLHFGALLMRTGIIDPMEQRNALIEEQIQKYIPGIFSRSDTLYPLRNSIPWALLQNGNPAIQNWKLNTNRFISVFRKYTQKTPLFTTKGWRGVEDDFRTGLSIAIRTMKNETSPEERACATTIVHRAMGQMLTIIGYDRLPFEMRDGKTTRSLPKIADLLDSPHGNHFKVCPSAGSFVKNGRRVIIDKEALGSYSSKSDLYDLTATPQILQFCDIRDAQANTDPSHAHFVGEKAERLAGSSDWLSMISAVAHFAVAFNPGAAWWDPVRPENQYSIRFPAAPFEAVENIGATGAVLPADFGALSLGLINLSIGTLVKKHLVYLDAEGNRLPSDTGATQIRISDEALPQTKVTTSLHSAIVLAETAFKLGATLKDLAAWDSRNKSATATEAKTNQKLIETMYAGEKIFSELTRDSSGSPRQILNEVKLGTALLLLQFAKREPGQPLTCYSEIVNDFTPEKGTDNETKQGTCSAEDNALWKYTLNLAAKEFQAPLFALKD